MIRENLRTGLITLGVLAIIATGITAYFSREKSYLTWEEYLATVEVYNRKLEEIRADCKNDVRCYEGKVIFRQVKSKKDVIVQFNQWIEDDEENPNTYKVSPIE